MEKNTGYFPGFVEIPRAETITDAKGEFVAYMVQTVHNTKGNSFVFRRFSEFDELRDVLRRKFPQADILPLPGKTLLKKNSKEFVENRRIQLEKFLQSTARLEDVSVASAFQSFLMDRKERDSKISMRDSRFSEEKDPKTPERTSRLSDDSFLSSPPIMSPNLVFNTTNYEETQKHFKEVLKTLENDAKSANQKAETYQKKWEETNAELDLVKEELERLNLSLNSLQSPSSSLQISSPKDELKNMGETTFISPSIQEENNNNNEGGIPPPPPPGPPGPPPPPGGIPMAPGSPALPARPPRNYMKKPTVNLKGLQWNKLDTKKLKGTVFDEFGEEMKGMELNYKEIEDLFGPKAKEFSVSPLKKQVSLESLDWEGTKLTQFLDNKTTQNIMIFLSQFKGISYSEIGNWISNLDSTKLNTTQVKSIKGFVASREEDNLIEHYVNDNGGDIKKLGTAEQFVYEVKKVQFLDEKLKMMLFNQEFLSKKREILRAIQIIKKACEQVSKDQSFKEMLELILVVGNYLNGGTKRGEAFGFKFAILSKLGDFKTSDNQKNLVQFLYEISTKQKPESLSFVEQLSEVGPASRLIYSGLKADISLLRKEYNEVDASLKAMEEAGEKITCREFIQKAGADVVLIQNSSIQLDSLYERTANYLAAEPSNTQPEEFFSTISKLLEDFKLAIKITKEQQQQEIATKRPLNRKLSEKFNQISPQRNRAATLPVAGSPK